MMAWDGFGWKASRTGVGFLSSPAAGGPRLKRVSCAGQLCVSVTIISAAWGPTTLVKVGVLIANTSVAKKGDAINKLIPVRYV